MSRWQSHLELCRAVCQRRRRLRSVINLGFLDSVLRGIGEVMLQNNSYAGLVSLIGLFYNSRLFALAVLVGTTASTATAMFLAWLFLLASPLFPRLRELESA